MKSVRALRLICLVMFCISLVLMLQIPTWLRLRKNDVADPTQTSFLTMKNNDLVQGEICYVLGCAATEQNGLWSTEIYGKSEKCYYVLWQPTGEMILYATNDAYEQLYLQRIMNETLAYTESVQQYQQSGDYEDLVPPVTTLQMQGVVSRMPRAVAEQFASWRNAEPNIDSTQCNTVYYISHTGFQRYMVLSIIGLCCMAITLILLCILPFAKKYAKRKMQQNRSHK